MRILESEHSILLIRIVSNEIEQHEAHPLPNKFNQKKYSFNCQSSLLLGIVLCIVLFYLK